MARCPASSVLETTESVHTRKSLRKGAHDGGCQSLPRVLTRLWRRDRATHGLPPGPERTLWMDPGLATKQPPATKMATQTCQNTATVLFIQSLELILVKLWTRRGLCLISTRLPSTPCNNKQMGLWLR
jgi:hypothetical protein